MKDFKQPKIEIILFASNEDVYTTSSTQIKDGGFTGNNNEYNLFS